MATTIIIDEKTNLTELVGHDGKHKDVADLFKIGVGKKYLEWGKVQHMTQAAFVDAFAKENAAKFGNLTLAKVSLESWIADYGLSEKFRKDDGPTAAGSPIGPFQLIPYNEDAGKEENGLVIQLGEVQTLGELRAKVASCAGVAESQFVLFAGQDNGENGTNFVKLTSLQQVENFPREDGAPVLLRYIPPGASSPPPSPEKKKREVLPFSELSRIRTLFSLPVSFAGEIPDFYDDETYRKLISHMSNPPVDNPSMLLLAVPGAGKTRTVEEAAKSIGASYHRVKFVDAHNFIQSLRATANATKGPPESYEAGKDLFVGACTAFVKKSLGQLSQQGIHVLHFDEVQCLMGTKLVSRHEESENMFDYVMPAFGDAITASTSISASLRVALSGTNFFAALVFNSGSQLKVDAYPMEGGFPLDYAKELLRKHFGFDSVAEDDQDTIIGQTCANRRALQHLGHHVELSVGVGKEVSKDVLEKAADAAYRDWSAPILRNIGNARKAALSLLALIAYPSAWKGEVTDGKLKVPTHELPKEVKQYALAGAVNVHHDINSQTDEILIPVGCAMRLLVDMCKTATAPDNMKEYEVFRNTSRSVLSDKGHFFERMIACELTFFSSGLYKTLLSPTGMTFNPDPRMLGKPFEYNARIHLADWNVGVVYCAKEDPQFTGERIVDVGFPVTSESVEWRIYCEAKVVNDVNWLWRQCWIFFKKMRDIGVGNDDNNVVAVFLSFHDFKESEPAQRKVKEGNVSAHDSRANVLRLLSDKAKYFAVLDGKDLAKAETVLPVVDLYKLIEKKEPTDHSVTELTDQVAGVYTSSSQPLQHMDSPTSKKMRISW